MKSKASLDVMMKTSMEERTNTAIAFGNAGMHNDGMPLLHESVAWRGHEQEQEMNQHE